MIKKKVILTIFLITFATVVFADFLPVTLTYFIGTKFGNSVLLEWETATEQDNLGFNLQRKNVQNEWETLIFIEGHGNSNVPHQYFYLDTTAIYAAQHNLIYYRLEQLDIDGGIDYPDSIEVDFPTSVRTEILATEFILHQNYPNPFNPSTKIGYSVAVGDGYSTADNVTLKVYDLLGREVSTLVNESKLPGDYEVKFYAENLPSGVYFYQLKTNNIILTKKMILLR